MPNWCQNEIRVSGSEDKVKEFMNFVKSDEQNFDFNSIVPMPKNIFKGALGAVSYTHLTLPTIYSV